jgi:NADH:ubiquinone oxidoreductase subunit C
VKKRLGTSVLEIGAPRPRRIFVHVNKGGFVKAIRYLTKQLEFHHVSTITGVDLGKAIEVIYHLNWDGAIELSLKVQVGKDTPVLPSITNLIPGATLYEREVHDLLGVVFEGHSNLSPLLLPESWPSDVYPLRKEWAIENVQKKKMTEGKP